MYIKVSVYYYKFMCYICQCIRFKGGGTLRPPPGGGAPGGRGWIPGAGGGVPTGCGKFSSSFSNAATNSRAEDHCKLYWVKNTKLLPYHLTYRFYSYKFNIQNYPPHFSILTPLPYLFHIIYLKQKIKRTLYIMLTI